jgi:LPS export ABC transporter protein LptC
LKKNSNPKKIRLFLFSIIFLASVTVVAVFIGYRHILGDRENFVATIQDKSDISISRVHHIATRKGKKEWSLDAQSAQMIASNKEVTLEDVSVIFFMENESEVHLTADHGLLNYGSNDIKLEGNVVVQRGDYTLKTETLHYNHSRRVFFSRVPVEIAGDAVNLAADTMSFDLNTKKTLFEGNVNGTFHAKTFL